MQYPAQALAALDLSCRFGFREAIPMTRGFPDCWPFVVSVVTCAWSAVSRRR